MSLRQDKEKAVNVQVLRCKPFSDDEIRRNAPQVVTCNDYPREGAITQTIAGKQFDRVFTFDKSSGLHCTELLYKGIREAGQKARHEVGISRVKQRKDGSMNLPVPYITVHMRMEKDWSTLQILALLLDQAR